MFSGLARLLSVELGCKGGIRAFTPSLVGRAGISVRQKNAPPKICHTEKARQVPQALYQFRRHIAA
jgi:hypothetical protein